MNKLLLFLLAIIVLPTHTLEYYQDIIVNNKVHATGVRSCQKRYETIKKVLQELRIKSPKVLDIGAAEGYFSFRVAHDFDASCVMIESDTRRPLKHLCDENEAINKNIILLEKYFNPSDFIKLAQCEQFDVVLCLNVIHHFRGHWKRAIDAIMQLGDTFIIETPPAGDMTAGRPYLGQINQYLKDQYDAKIIGKFSRHTTHKEKSNMYLIQKPKCKTAFPNGSISFSTFKRFGGVFPIIDDNN